MAVVYTVVVVGDDTEAVMVTFQVRRTVAKRGFRVGIWYPEAETVVTDGGVCLDVPTWEHPWPVG